MTKVQNRLSETIFGRTDMNESMLPLICVRDLHKVFITEEVETHALSVVHLEINKGEYVSIAGPSGCGKSTLLSILGLLDSPTKGSYVLNSTPVEELTASKRARIRNREVGFIFQSFNLLPTLTALENVMVPIELLGQKNVKPVAIDLLEKVGLGDRIHHYPTQLSGGEQQRVSIARAFANQPKILFADEPTGNLDEETGATIEKLIFNLNKELGTTLILVTHDDELAAKTNRILKLKGGKLAEDSQQNTILSDTH